MHGRTLVGFFGVRVRASEAADPAILDAATTAFSPCGDDTGVLAEAPHPTSRAGSRNGHGTDLNPILLHFTTDGTNRYH